MRFYKLLGIYSGRPNPWDWKFSSATCPPLCPRTQSEGWPPPALLPPRSAAMLQPFGTLRSLQRGLGRAVPRHFQAGRSGRRSESPAPRCQTGFPRGWGAGISLGDGGAYGPQIHQPQRKGTKSAQCYPHSYSCSDFVLTSLHGALGDRRNCNTPRAAVISKAAQFPAEHNNLNHLCADGST